MFFLIFSILTSLGILVVFKISGRRNVPALEMVLLNYFTAFGVGLIIQKQGLVITGALKSGFFIFGSVIGICFVLMFLFIDFAINKTGISIVSSATKLSVVIPILISALIDPNDIFSLFKGIGMIIMFMALVLLMINRSEEKNDKRKYLIPFLLFVCMGMIDSTVKFSQQYFVPQGHESLFSLYVFLNSFLFAFLLIIQKRKVKSLIRSDVIVFGVLLGAFNFGSLFFLLKGLNLNLYQSVFLDSSRILMFNNIGIVLMSVIVGLLFFREKLSVYNYFGILLSIIGFYFLI